MGIYLGLGPEEYSHTHSLNSILREWDALKLWTGSISETKLLHYIFSHLSKDAYDRVACVSVLLSILFVYVLLVFCTVQQYCSPIGIFKYNINKEIKRKNLPILQDSRLHMTQYGRTPKTMRIDGLLNARSVLDNSG